MTLLYWLRVPFLVVLAAGVALLFYLTVTRDV